MQKTEALKLVNFVYICANYYILVLSEMLQLSLDLAKNRIGSVSQDIRKLFVNIMANLIEKSTVCCLMHQTYLYTFVLC